MKSYGLWFTEAHFVDNREYRLPPLMGKGVLNLVAPLDWITARPVDQYIGRASGYGSYHAMCRWIESICAGT